MDQNLSSFSVEKSEIDAVAVWLKGAINSVISDPSQGERIFRQIPALLGLLLYKKALAVSRMGPEN